MILNLTQHASTPEQRAQGVADLGEAEQVKLKSLLTFDSLPAPHEIHLRSAEIAALAASKGAEAAMIGGAPYLMSALESELLKVGVNPIYAFSVRESVEEVQPDGSVVKRNVFRHAGFVRPYEAE